MSKAATQTAPTTSAEARERLAALEQRIMDGETVDPMILLAAESAITVAQQLEAAKQRQAELQAEAKRKQEIAEIVASVDDWANVAGFEKAEAELRAAMTKYLAEAEETRDSRYATANALYRLQRPGDHGVQMSGSVIDQDVAISHDGSIRIAGKKLHVTDPGTALRNLANEAADDYRKSRRRQMTAAERRYV